MRLLGIDTGGTFTDFIYLDNGQLYSHKVLSTPASPEAAIIQGIKELGMEMSGLKIVHGSTVATNAVLQGKGANTVYITNTGFADVLSIGRQARKELYNLTPEPGSVPVAAENCLEVNCRIAADGSIVQPLQDEDIARLLERIKQLKPEAVAINFLFSFINDEDEQRVARALPKNMFISLSSEVLQEVREYERGITTWLNAYIGPLMQGYLQRLEKKVTPASVAVMRSSAETCAASIAAEQGVQLLLSGPAGGLAGAQYIGQCLNRTRLITLDMGGTSTDVALLDGSIPLTGNGSIGPYPVAIPMVDMHTIGAGGGSIAYVDAAGGLQVGPQSAGADPGPICYNQGGTAITVTDCNLILGRMPDSVRFGNRINPDVAAASQALSALAAQLDLADVESAAHSVIELVNEHMLQALRSISIHKGIDPRDYTLCAFGGAGGLHICALADALEVESALVPAYAGVLSALGMTVAAAGRQHSHTVARLLSEVSSADIETWFAELLQSGAAELIKQGHEAAAVISKPSLDLCYQGQSSALNLPWSGSKSDISAAFEELHMTRYGHRLPRPVELVTVRLGVMTAANEPELPEQKTETPDPNNANNVNGTRQLRRMDGRLAQPHTGPVIIYDDFSTIWVPQHWQAEHDNTGNLLLNRCTAT